MTMIERSTEIAVPARTAYDLYTQFELFPRFMDGVEEVRQLDERRLHWRAKIWGQEREWTAEITEQIPDKRIAWTTKDGPHHSGVVTFHRLDDDRCRVMLQMEYDPDGLPEKLADALGVIGRRVDDDLARFRSFAEQKAEEVDGWRGQIPTKDEAARSPAASSGLA